MAYAHVDPRVVWDTVQDDLPGLIQKLEQVLGRDDTPHPPPEPESGKNAPTRVISPWQRTTMTMREDPDLNR